MRRRRVKRPKPKSNLSLIPLLSASSFCSLSCLSLAVKGLSLLELTLVRDGIQTESDV